MKKPLLFYVIDEHTDELAYCKRRGLTPCKWEDRRVICSDPSVPVETFQEVVQYKHKDGFVYDVLDGAPCIDFGCEIVLMRLPKLPYEVLLTTALTSKSEEERIGSIEVILRDHSAEFEQYLTSVQSMDIHDLKRTGILRLSTFIMKWTSPTKTRDSIRSLCESLTLTL